MKFSMLLYCCMENFFVEIRKFVLSKILGRKYYRTGKCNACGKCCTKIYVKHFKHVIQDEEEFKKLQYLHRFYTYLKVIDKDETGLVFECQNLDKETHKCKIHKSRPGICRRYPQEELFSMGGALSDDCGYKMLPIVPFAKVLKKLSKKKFLLTLITLCAITNCANALNGFSDNFIENFKTCNLYGEENSLNNKGTVFHDMKFFYKNKDGNCNYNQIILTSYGSQTLRCVFDKNQVKEIYTTMRENNPKNKYDNSAENLWNNYVNQSSSCKLKTESFLNGTPKVQEYYLPWKT